ncbi:hypothetical protein K758_04761 [Escherichia coli ATCC 25922]|nr:hypothetical protein K758_04761 [Escherichia coli ATCC 25922]
MPDALRLSGLRRSCNILSFRNFVGWIRRSRRIRHEQRAQNPPSLRLNPFRHFRPLTAKDNFFRFFLKLIAIHRVVIFFK